MQDLMSEEFGLSPATLTVVFTGDGLPARSEEFQNAQENALEGVRQLDDVRQVISYAGSQGPPLYLGGWEEVLRGDHLQSLHRRDAQRGRRGEEQGPLRRARYLRNGGAGRLPGPRGGEQRGREAGREVRLPVRRDHPDLRLRYAGRRRCARSDRGRERGDGARRAVLHRGLLRHVRVHADALDDARARARHRLRAVLRQPFQGGARETTRPRRRCRARWRRPEGPSSSRGRRS